MARRFVLLASLLAVTLSQTTQSQQISLDPNAGPLKLRIVFQSDNQQQTAQAASPCASGNCQATPTLSPCASGNCGAIQPVQPQIQVQASPCSTGNCGQQQASPCATGNCGAVAGSANIVPAFDASAFTTTTAVPVTVRAVPIVSSNSSPVKVIRIPSYSSNNGCFSPPCGAPRFVFAQPPCFGNSCGPRFFYPRRRHFFGPRQIVIGNRNNNNNVGGNVAIPDTIYKNGQAIRAPIRVPSSYQDGNPVFNSGR